MRSSVDFIDQAKSFSRAELLVRVELSQNKVNHRRTLARSKDFFRQFRSLEKLDPFWAFTLE
jgi:hypothetical protein